jgi:hypothetical protein
MSDLPGVTPLELDTTDPGATVHIEGKEIIVVVRKGDKGDKGDPGPTSLVNPMTAQHDLLVGGPDGVPTRMAAGTEGQVPTIFGGALVYRTPASPTGLTDPHLIAIANACAAAGVATGIVRKVGADTYVVDGTAYLSDIEVVVPLASTGGATPTLSIPAATATTPGHATAAQISKLDGIAPNANDYSHPATHPPTVIAQDINNRFVSDAEKAAWNGKQAALGFTPFANPMTAASDLIVGGPGGVASRLAIGAEGQVPTVFGGALVYKTPSTGTMTNPMTALGDIIVGGDAGAPTRVGKGSNGTLWGVMNGSPGYYNPSTLGLSAAGSGVVIVSGMDNMGQSNSTAALDAAMAALPSTGGVLVIPDPGFGTGYKFNLKILKSGVQVIFPGRDWNGGYRCIPWDTTKPVVQFGSDAGDVDVKFSSVSNGYLYGGNVSKYGVIWQPGAQYCRADNMMIRNFNTVHAGFMGGTAKPTQFNFLDNFCIESSATIADGGVYPIGVLWEDKTTTGNGWVTACYVSNGNINVHNGHTLVIDSSSAAIDNVYMDQQAGHGVVFRNNGRYEPFLWAQGLIIDTGSYSDSSLTVAMTMDFEYDLRGNTGANHLSAFIGSPDFTCGDKVMFTAGHTTGNIQAGQNLLTVASLTGINMDRQIMVHGAGVSGAWLIANITEVNGLVLTLSVAAATTVTSADVMYGNVSAEKAFKGSGNTPFLAPAGLWLTPNSKSGLEARGSKGQLYRTGSSGDSGPWAGVEHVWDFGINDGLSLFSEPSYAVDSVSSMSRTGNVVTVNTPTSHGAQVGDFIVVDGVFEAGFNGTFPVATRPSATQLTYISPITQTLAGVTGTPIIQIATWIKFKQGKLTVSWNYGLCMRNRSGGEAALFYGSESNNTLYQQMPDTVNGTLALLLGTGLGNNTTCYSIQAMNSTCYRLTTNGHIWLKNTSLSPTNIAGGAFYYVDANGRHRVKDAAGNDGALISTACSTATLTTAAPTLTTSATAVMMGCAGTITPLQSTRLLVTISGQMANSVAGSGAKVEFRYGTGTKPVNGAAASGTVIGIAQEAVSVSAGQKSGFSVTGIITGLTPGTAYWLDASLLALTNGNATITGVTIAAVEV